MQPSEFESYLHRQIPLTKTMGISVTAFSPTFVAVQAPLMPNINHKGTFFGGSIGTVMTVCGWSLMFANMRLIDQNAHIVIANSEVTYLKPITGTMFATCTIEDTQARDTFLTRYRARGKARTSLTVGCKKNGVELARFVGQFVAVRDT